VIGVFNQTPHFRDPHVCMNVNGANTATANGNLPSFPRLITVRRVSDFAASENNPGGGAL